MAISKILHMKDCGKAFHGKHLKTAITYITVPEKTQNGRLVSAVNCQIEYAYEQMKSTKQKFGKIDKRQVIYALSDFLIMILSWLVKQSLRAFLFQEVQL